jgi:hypothetical protein
MDYGLWARGLMFNFLGHRGLWIKDYGLGFKFLRVDGLGVRGFRDFLLRN